MSMVMACLTSSLARSSLTRSQPLQCLKLVEAASRSLSSSLQASSARSLHSDLYRTTVR